MKPQLKATGNFKSGQNAAQFENIPIFVINEENTVIYYTPVFDISGYGSSDKEASESLKTSIDEFFKYTMNKKTLDSELTRLGWIKPKRKKRYNLPDVSKMIQKHEYLADIIDNHDFRKETMPIAVPA